MNILWKKNHLRNEKKDKKFIKASILFILFLDILSFGILIPLLPELKALYDVSNTAIGFGLIVYELCAFFAAPILGQLSDHFGRKKLLLICIIGNILSWSILILSQSYLLFIIARIVNGITGGNISIVKSIGIDISPSSQEKKKFFSYFGALFGLAFVIWPFFGGLLLPYGYQAPFILALVLNIFSFVLLAFFLPETWTSRKKDTTSVTINYNTFWKIIEVFRIKKIRSLLRATVFLFLWYFSYQGIISLFLDTAFHMSGTHIAYILSWIGIFTAINQLFLIEKFWLKYFSDKTLNTITFILLVLLTWGVAYFVNNLWVVIIGLFIISFFYTTLPPVFSTALVEQYDKNKVWEINGVIDSVLTLMIVVALGISSFAIDYWQNIFLFSLVFFTLARILSSWYFKQTK